MASGRPELAVVMPALLSAASAAAGSLSARLPRTVCKELLRVVPGGSACAHARAAGLSMSDQSCSTVLTAARRSEGRVSCWAKWRAEAESTLAQRVRSEFRRSSRSARWLSCSKSWMTRGTSAGTMRSASSASIWTRRAVVGSRRAAAKAVAKSAAFSGAAGGESSEDGEFVRVAGGRARAGSGLAEVSLPVAATLAVCGRGASARSASTPRPAPNNTSSAAEARSLSFMGGRFP